jgi:hypothetical protein
MIPSKYLVSPEQHEKVFTSLQTQFFSQLQPVEMPIAVIVGGQPGAGKTIINSSLKNLYNNNIAVINGDDYRELHPYYLEIAEENDKNIAEYTEVDVRDWTSRLFNLSINKSYNTALEITLRQDKPILATLENLNRFGYRSQLKVIAVKKEFSILGIHQRYEFQRSVKGFGRWTTQEAHDASYDNMHYTILALEASPFLSSISISCRDGSKIYENHRDSYGLWVNRTQFAWQTILNFRNKPLNQDDMQKLVSSWKTLIDQKLKRHAPSEEIELAKNHLTKLTETIEPDPSLFRPRF